MLFLPRKKKGARSTANPLHSVYSATITLARAESDPMRLSLTAAAALMAGCSDGASSVGASSGPPPCVLPGSHNTSATCSLRSPVASKQTWADSYPGRPPSLENMTDDSYQELLKCCEKCGDKVLQQLSLESGCSFMAKKKKPKVVPRRGPATNLRKAGAHDDIRAKTLERLSDKERELDDLKSLGRWALNEDE
jgi:hypothetical protein